MLSIMWIVLYLILLSVIIISILLGRKNRLAVSLATKSVPITLLLTLAGLLLWTDGLGLAPFLIILIAIIAAVLASWCAFCPGKLSFVAALVFSCVGIVFFVMLDAFPTTLRMILNFGLIVTASVAGIAVLRKVKLQETSEKIRPEESEPKEQEPESGVITIWGGEYDGGQIPLCDGEELRIGSDPVLCQLVMPELSRHQCSIRFIARRNTYLVASFTKQALFDANGEAVPPNVTVEVPGGTPFRLGFTEQVILLG